MAKTAQVKKETTSFTAPKKESSYQASFVFGRINYILMFAGIVVIAVGYLLMIGGHPEDPAVFNSKELYSPVRITVAPIIIVIGLIIEVVAIMIKAKD